MFDMAEIHGDHISKNVSIFSSISTFPVMYTSFTFCWHFVGCDCEYRTGIVWDFWQLKVCALMNKKLNSLLVDQQMDHPIVWYVVCWGIQGQFDTQHFCLNCLVKGRASIQFSSNFKSFSGFVCLKIHILSSIPTYRTWIGLQKKQCLSFWGIFSQ